MSNQDTQSDCIAMEDETTVKISCPENTEDIIDLNIKGVPETVWGHGAKIDYFHGRPILYIGEPDLEDAAWAFVLPTEEDPELHTYIADGEVINETKQLLSDPTHP